MRKIVRPILALTAFAFSGLTMLAAVGPASAALVSNVPIYQHIQGDRVELSITNVAQKGGHSRASRDRSVRYNRDIHGHRYRNRRAGYTYYDGRYWYRSAWWLVDDPTVIGVFGASSDRCYYVSGQCTLRHGYGNGIFWLCMKNDDCA